MTSSFYPDILCATKYFGDNKMNEIDKNQAIRELHEIKQVMEKSRKRFNRGKYWLGPLVAVLSIFIAFLFFPFFAPVIGTGFLVGGIIAWRWAGDSTAKKIAAGVLFAVGIILILYSIILISVVGLYTTTTIPPTTTPLSYYH